MVKFCAVACLLFTQISWAGLNAQQEAVLSKASQTQCFMIRKVDFGFDGRPNQTVVFLGESHVKTESCSSLGLEILKAFQLRGLEGVSSSDLRDNFGITIRTLAELSGSVQNVLKWVVGEGSTISDSSSEGFTLTADGDFRFNGQKVGYFYPLDNYRICTQCMTESQILSNPILTRYRKLLESINGDGKYCIEFTEPRVVLPENPMSVTINVNLEIGGLAPYEFQVPNPADEIHFARNSRMVNGLLATLYYFKDQEAILVIVGALHVRGMASELSQKASEDSPGNFLRD